MEAQEFGARLKELRKQFGLTQRELANKVDVDFSYLSKIESGAAPPPSEKVILRLAEVLNADKDELLTLAGKIPPDIAEALKNREARQLLRSKRTQTIIRASNKISGCIKMGSQNLINYGSILKSSLSLVRIAIAVVLVVAVATSLWFASPARAFDISIARPTSGTLGSTYTFSTTVTIATGERVPIQRVDFAIYNVADRATYEASCTNVPDNGTENYTDAQTGGGSVTVTSTPTAGWLAGYTTGTGYAYWQGKGYSFGATYGYGYGGGSTTVTYDITWTPPSSWPAGSYKIQFRVTANGTTLTQTSGAFSLVAPAVVGAPGAPPAALPPGTKDISVIVDSQGKFTEAVTHKSEDGKVELEADGEMSRKFDGHGQLLTGHAIHYDIYMTFLSTEVPV